ncbi:WXG100 family type VII secretion target [Nocardia sp. CA-290969]|uniref:WXG100 family type VII secretion target n=1 Tax=Nocardia sp. CA-290969 TaxID=3239986 RepID=UPI003D8FADF8
MTFTNEGPKINDPEKPGGFSHQEINGAFKPLVPGDHGMMASDQYGQIAQQWENGVTVFASRIRRSSAAAWEGTAAEQARQAIDNYAKRAEDLVPVLHALSVQVENAVVAIMRTQNNLPEVIEKKPGWHMDEWTIFGFDNERTDNEEAARQVMQDHYVAGFTQADGLIPVLPVPVNPTQPLHTDNGNGDQPGPGGTTTNPGGNPTGTDTGQPAGENPTEEEPGEEQPGEEAGTDQPTGTEQPGETPANTTPSTTESPVPTTPSTTTMPSTTTTGPGSPGAPGLPSGSPVTTGDPGRTVSGAPNTAGAPVAAATGTTNSGAPRGGMPGMMSPGMAGRGQQGGDDDKHDIPDYLINAENTEELLGELPPTIPGGVLGGDVPAARPAERD